MPELPEVETVRRGLERAKVRGSVVEVWRSPFPLRTGAAWAREHEETHTLVGARPIAVQRRGKFLIWEFDAPDGARLAMLVHLGMSGRLELTQAGAPIAPHTHLRLGFEGGRQVRFVDPRRFGGIRVAPRDRLQAEPPLVHLGPEPLDRSFDGAVLEARGGASKRALREVLLDQRVVAGLGNIYVTEALWEAGLHPLVPARRLRPSAWARLAGAVALVLRRALANGGTTLRDYRNAEGESGRNQLTLRAYGRAGEGCPRCESVRLVGYVHQGRSGAYCPAHQPRPRGRWIV